MFDLRYHVASLAAVFIALAVGIILGVAISGKVGGAEDALNAYTIRQLQDDLASQKESVESDEARLDSLDTYVDRTYGELVTDRLAGTAVAIVVLGRASDGVRNAVTTTLDDAGAVSARTVALDVPVDSRALTEFLKQQEALSKYAGDFGALGRALGEELVKGTGDEAILPTIQEELVEELQGSTTAQVDGVVVVRGWRASTNDRPGDDRATENLLDGVVDGLKSQGVPVVGVTTSSLQGARAVQTEYRQGGISTVDDVDYRSGRLALALLLDGARTGNYGFIMDDDDGAIPPLTQQEPGGG
ncbi:MAG TPA: copper transporter [Gaiellaceae bacterium]|jgi:hypothetical protein